MHTYNVVLEIFVFTVYCTYRKESKELGFFEETLTLLLEYLPKLNEKALPFSI